MTMPSPPGQLPKAAVSDSPAGALLWNECEGGRDSIMIMASVAVQVRR
jgi:hypothetical protein